MSTIQETRLPKVYKVRQSQFGWKKHETDWWALSRLVEHDGRAYEAEIFLNHKGVYEPVVIMTDAVGEWMVGLKLTSTIAEAKDSVKSFILNK